MGLVGVDDVLDLALEHPERDEQLLAIARRAAQVGAALQEQQRRPDIRHVAEGALAPQSIDPGPIDGRTQQRRAVVLDAGVAGRPARDLVRHAVLAHRRLEPGRGGDQPVDHEPAVRQAERAEAVRVREAEPDDMVDRGMDVGRVDAAPVAQLRADPVATVRLRAADVRQDHAIARRPTSRSGRPVRALRGCASRASASPPPSRHRCASGRPGAASSQPAAR